MTHIETMLFRIFGHGETNHGYSINLKLGRYWDLLSASTFLNFHLKNYSPCLKVRLLLYKVKGNYRIHLNPFVCYN